MQVLFSCLFHCPLQTTNYSSSRSLFLQPQGLQRRAIRFVQRENSTFSHFLLIYFPFLLLQNSAISFFLKRFYFSFTTIIRNHHLHTLKKGLTAPYYTTWVTSFNSGDSQQIFYPFLWSYLSFWLNLEFLSFTSTDDLVSRNNFPLKWNFLTRNTCRSPL